MSTIKYTLETWLRLFAGLTGLFVTCFIIKLIRHRRFYRKLPSPAHSPLLGNLAVLGEYVKRYPSDIHPQPMFTDIARGYSLPGLFYMDLFPFETSMIFITDPALALRIQSDVHTYIRHPFVLDFLGGIAGKNSLFSTKGAEWQRQRSWFMPAFSMQNLLTLVPGMIEETLVFRERLTKAAVTGEVFSMNDWAMRLAIDFIGRTVGDIRLKSQTEDSDVYNAFQNATSWTAGQMDPRWKRILSPYMINWHTRTLDRHLGATIREKMRDRREDGVDKSILDLALRGYLKDKGKVGTGGSEKGIRPDLDEKFMQIALDNAKLFFAGGHDTTAGLVTYHFYLLSTHPDILARVREEHDSIFGPTLDSTISTLRNDPALLNKLPLTHAVLKESLRLHPAGFTIRATVDPNMTINYNGVDYPMGNHMIAILGMAMHRDPAVWGPDADKFNPDRWLSPKTHSNAAWQPFEKGPRNCIGQQLALLEVRAISVLVTRFFDFEAVFGSHGLKVDGYGGRAYQELKLTAKPKDGIPMRARLVKV